jgi:hypothetical protein
MLTTQLNQQERILQEQSRTLQKQEQRLEIQEQKLKTWSDIEKANEKEATSHDHDGSTPADNLSLLETVL